MSNTGDSHSVHGLGWKRETGDTIKNKHFQGPERGKFEFRMCEGVKLYQQT